MISPAEFVSQVRRDSKGFVAHSKGNYGHDRSGYRDVYLRYDIFLHGRQRNILLFA